MKASLLLVFFSIFILNSTQSEMMQGQRKNANNNIGILENSFKYLLQAEWDEIRADYPEDLKKILALYQHVSTIIAANCNAANFYEFQQEVRSYLIRKSTETLAKKFNIDYNTPAILELHSFLTNNYELTLLNSIYLKAIDELFDYKDIRLLAAHLNNIYHKDNHNVKAYQIMVQMQLHLFQKFLDSDDDNGLYLLNVAYYLYRSKNDAYYNRLCVKGKRNFENMVSKLPSTLKYFFFESQICLSNNKDQYLYTTLQKINDDHRFVFLYTKNNAVDDQFVFLSNFTEVPAIKFGDVSVKVSLKSKRFDSFINLESSLAEHENIVTGLGYASDRTIWSVVFADGKLLLKQDNKLLCSTDEYYYEHRTKMYVQGFADEKHSPETKACQWKARICPDFSQI